MTARFAHRWRAQCGCGWATAAYHRHVMERAADVHTYLKPGHTAEVVPIGPGEER